MTKIVLKSELQPTKQEQRIIINTINFDILIKHSKNDYECFNCAAKYKNHIDQCRCGDNFKVQSYWPLHYKRNFTNRKSLYKFAIVDVFRKRKDQVVKLTYYKTIEQRNRIIYRTYNLIRKTTYNMDGVKCYTLQNLRLYNHFGNILCNGDFTAPFVEMPIHRKTASFDYDSINLGNLMTLPYLKHFTHSKEVSTSTVIHLMKLKKWLPSFIKKYKSYFKHVTYIDNITKPKLKLIMSYKKQVSSKTFNGIINHYYTWKDYYELLSAEEKLIPEIVFQENWMRVHDIRMKEFKVLDSIDSEAKFNMKYYNYPNELIDDTYIIIPNGCKDLENEGTKLNHCVRTYYDKVHSGESLIFFIRDDMDVPLWTCEVKNNVIYQFYGYNHKTKGAVDYRMKMLEYLKKYEPFDLNYI